MDSALAIFFVTQEEEEEEEEQESRILGVRIYKNKMNGFKIIIPVYRKPFIDDVSVQDSAAYQVPLNNEHTYVVALL